MNAIIVPASIFVIPVTLRGWTSPCTWDVNILSFSRCPQFWLCVHLKNLFFLAFDPSYLNFCITFRPEVVAQRRGQSQPANNRPFMMPRNAMMIPLCPPPPFSTSLHSCTRMWSNKLPLPPPSPPRRHHHRYHHHHLTSAAAIATEAPLSQIEKMKKARNYRGGGGGDEGGGGSTDRAQREDSWSVTYTLGGKKEGHPFKCGAAALIHWVKMGKKREWQRSDSGILPHSSAWMACHRIITTQGPYKTSD